MLEYDNGVVYELSDEKFIFDLFDFSLPQYSKMTNIFDILKKDYIIIEGIGNYDFHAQIMLLKVLKSD